MEQESKNEEQPANPTQTFIFQQPQPKPTNGIGTAGFILALISLIFSWAPVLGWILWILGFVFSLVGVFRQPKGLAIAGLVISSITFIALLAMIGLFAALIGLSI